MNVAKFFNNNGLSLLQSSNALMQSPIANIKIKKFKALNSLRQTDLLSLEDHVFLIGGMLLYMCPCGCSQARSLENPEIISEEPLTIKNILKVQFLSDTAKFKIIEGNIIFEKDSGSHMKYLPKGLHPKIH